MFPSQMRELERQHEVVNYKNKTMDIREQYREKALQFAKDWDYLTVSDHILDIMVSIMATRDKTSYAGGGFVEAIVSNNLYLAVSRADYECSQHLKLLTMCCNNCYL